MLRHLAVLGTLLGLAVPIWIYESRMSPPSGRDWIALDLRGVYTVIYVALWAAFAVVSSLFAWAVRRKRLSGVSTYLLSAIATAAFLVGGHLLFEAAGTARDAWAARRGEALSAHVDLRSWAVSPTESARVASVELSSSAPLTLTEVTVRGECPNSPAREEGSGSAALDSRAELVPGRPLRLSFPVAFNLPLRMALPSCIRVAVSVQIAQGDDRGAVEWTQATHCGDTVPSERGPCRRLVAATVPR